MINATTLRPILCLMRCTVPVMALLLSGCSIICDSYREKETTKEDAQHPAVVLLTRSADNIKNLPHKPVHRIVKDAHGNDSVTVDFNWEKIWVAGVPLSTFPKRSKAIEFTLNVFEYETGRHIPSASITEFEPIDGNDRPLIGIPLDTLLRVDFLFKMESKKEEDKYAPPANFVLMFKKGKDLQEAPPQEARPVQPISR